MTAPVKLNLGAGDDHREGFVSIDLRPEADVTADIRDLSAYPDGSVDELLALDILEHFWRDDVPAVLTEWRRVLRPGGRLTLRIPNMHALARQIVRGTHVEATIRNIYGGHRWGPDGSWDAHHWGWTPQTLAPLLAEFGYRILSNDGRTNMTVCCERL